MAPYSLCITANTHGSLTLSSSLTFTSVGHVVSTKWGKRVSGFITDPHGWLAIQPTISLAIVHNDVSPALARQVRRDREYIIIYIMIYNYIYMFEGSAGPTSDPHVWPLITARHVTCISVAYMGACQYRHTKRRGMSSTTLCRYMSYTDVYGYIYARDTTGPIYVSHTCEVGPAPLYLYNARWRLLSH